MRVYVTNLPAGTNGADLAVLCAPFGPVTASGVWGETGTDRQHWVGFVALSAGADAVAVALNGSEYRGKRLEVQVVRPWDGTGPGRV